MCQHNHDKNLAYCRIKCNVVYCQYGKLEHIKAAYPLFYGGANPPDERKEGLPMYVTYSDLIQIGIFICALVGLCYQIFKGKK